MISLLDNYFNALTLRISVRSVRQVHHHGSVRLVRERRSGGSGGVLGGLFQQRLEPVDLRIFQSRVSRGLSQNPRKLLPRDWTGARPAPGASQTGSRAQQRLVRAARQQSVAQQRDDQRPH